MSKIISFIFIPLLVAGCARSSTVPLANDMIQINTTAAPICGGAGAANVASKNAAVETLRHGFDKYVIVGSEAASDIVGIHYGVIQRSHDQGLIVKMFKNEDPQGANAISAREVLGAKWAEIIKSPTLTCLD